MKLFFCYQFVSGSDGESVRSGRTLIAKYSPGLAPAMKFCYQNLVLEVLQLINPDSNEP
ncbi:hypothetical protein [Pedobacter nutrimenti]|uniref:hypothetical protein n=1 Tax=Pedobacter nutrimenti TaxID=1241337 RepID=UPI0014739575|nr:hypothetical protein [Pedobacter nutrimenti]